MNKVLKKALGFAGALGLTAAMVLAAAPVQASDVDARIQVLERELAQLKQNQESALAAEMKGPAFKYSAGKGLTIAAADNNWSITFGQRLQIYSSMYLTNDDPGGGFQNGVIRVRRFRPNINVTSQQGFYEVKWTFSGNSSVAFDGDAYLHFEKLNPFLPTVGYGYNPSFNGNKNQGYGRTEDSAFINALAMGGSQDGSVVLNWGKLPAMGISKIKHLAIAMGLDEQDEYGRGPGHGTDGRSMAFGLGIQPLAKAKTMGGFNVSSLTYNFAYESMNDLSEGPGSVYGPTTQERISIVNGGKVLGDHTYMFHNLSWSPLKWFGLAAHVASYEADAESGAADDIEASEVRLAAVIWLWGPKSGMMGGSKKEGGIYVSPMYSVTEIDSNGQEGTNSGVAVVYNVPGGWMQIHGVWDSLGCEHAGCTVATADDGDNSANVFTLIAEYRF
ncbi:MAG: hypothetical protein OXE53_05575 [Deltaproteobacteria bacterium]|nr:hypothetical protein [Deltaproteobacteria bacterium]